LKDVYFIIRNSYYCHDCAGRFWDLGLGLLSRQTFWQTGNPSLVTVSGIDDSLAAVFWLVCSRDLHQLSGILFLLVASAGFYILLGRELRELGQDAILKQRATERLAAETAHQPSPTKNSHGSEEPTQLKLEALPIPEEDLIAIKGIFGIDTFFATETIAYQEGAIFKGNMRGEPEAVHNRLTASLQERLGNKYSLFLVENPDGRPVIIVLPSRNDPRPMTLPQKVFAGILLVATFATSLETAGVLLNFDFFTNPERFQEVLPISLGVLAVLVAHEIGHWLLARRHQVRLSWPFFLPAVQIASFGAQLPALSLFCLTVRYYLISLWQDLPLGGLFLC